MSEAIPSKIELRRSRKYAFGIVAPMLAVFGFFAYPLGIIGLVLWLILLGLVRACWPAFLRYIAQLPPRVILDDKGLHFGDVEERTVIPWPEIEDVELCRARNGLFLGIRVRRPEKFLDKFVKINLRLSRFHFVVRISELDRSPRRIVDSLHEFWRFYS